MKKTIFSLLIFGLLFSSTLTAQPAAELFDEFGWVPCEELVSRLDHFLQALSNKPDTMGLVYVYEGKYKVRLYGKRGSRTETRVPVFGEAAHRTNIFRSHIGQRKFDPDRYLFVDAGLRENFTVQLWIVPKGSLLPPAKPTLERMSFRKGKFAAIECP